jgi:hypothetical protein
LMYLRRVQIYGRDSAAALMQVLTVATPPALAAQNLGMGLRKPCRGRAIDGMLRVMARIAFSQPAMPPNGSRTTYARNRCVSILWRLKTSKLGMGRTRRTHAPRTITR